jgi:hypothetical protein
MVGLCAAASITLALLNGRSRGLTANPTNTKSQKTLVPTFNASAQTFIPIIPPSTQPQFPPQLTGSPTLIPVPFSSIPTEILPGTPVTAVLTLDRDYNCRGGTSRNYDAIRPDRIRLAIIRKSEVVVVGESRRSNTRRKQCGFMAALPQEISRMYRFY